MLDTIINKILFRKENSIDNQTNRSLVLVVRSLYESSFDLFKFKCLICYLNMYFYYSLLVFLLHNWCTEIDL